MMVTCVQVLLCPVLSLHTILPNFSLELVVLVGEAGTGKSKILTRYMKEDYDHSYSTIIGVEFGNRTISQLRTKL